MTDVLGLGSWEVGVTLESRNNRSRTSTVKPSAVHRNKKKPVSHYMKRAKNTFIKLDFIPEKFLF